MNRIILKAILLPLLFCACNLPGRHADEDMQQPVYGINWYLQKIYQPGGNMEIKKPMAYISFDAAKKTASGNGGCNRFGSNCRLEGKKISIREMFSTEMYCVDYQSQEDLYFRKLQDVNRYEVKDGKLLLYRDNELLLEFGK